MTPGSVPDGQDRAIEQLCVPSTEPHFGVLGRATYAGSDDPEHAVRRRRVYRYLRQRHRALGNGAHPLTRISATKPVKLEGH